VRDFDSSTVTGRRSMNNTTSAVIALAPFLQGLAAAACEDRGSAAGPTATGVPATIAISGVVYDTLHRLLGGARVEVIEGAVGDWCHHGVQPALVCVVATVTDRSGRFLFSAPGGSVTFGSVTRLLASMEGYVAATLTVDSSRSNGAIEFRLEPSVAP
jgi:hypothetical protein